MARGSQTFRAECKFPSFIQQQINICLAKKVTVYTGVYLASPYFIVRVKGKHRCAFGPPGQAQCERCKLCISVEKMTVGVAAAGRSPWTLVFPPQAHSQAPKCRSPGLEAVGLAHLPETSACAKVQSHSRTVIPMGFPQSSLGS